MRLQSRPKASLRLNKKSANKVCARCRVFYNAINGNKAVFATPNPTMAAFLALIQAVEAGSQSIPGGLPGSSAARDVKCQTLILAAETLLHYVQGLADSAATREQAIAIIEAASMKVSSFGTPARALLTVEPTALGAALLRANGAALTKSKKGSKTFHWWYSLDGGKTWLFGAATPRARATISGLPRLTEIAFRVRASYVKGGESDWCAPVVAVLG